MERIVFYSWQSDLPGSTNRYFIETALERATAAIVSDDTVEVEPVLDRDTLGVAGSPDITSTIFGKIEKAHVFVADISIIGKVDGKRPTPNPNVLIELGYALHALGQDRIILLFNLEYGAVEDLPFDLRTRRIMTYELGANAPEKAPVRNRLAKQLTEAIRLALPGEEPPAPQLSATELAITAIESAAANRIIPLRKALQQLMAAIDEAQPLKPSEGGTIQQLEAAIDATSPIVADFAKVSEAIAIMNDGAMAEEVHRWFGHLFQRYDLPQGFQGRFREDDFDYFKFMGHELYVTFIAFLLKEKRWDTLETILNEPIPVNYLRYQNGPGTVHFVEISQHLSQFYDESRLRHLVSLQATILRDRHSQPPLTDILSLYDFMAADLFLFLAAEIPEEQRSQWYSWRPMSTLYLKSAPPFLIEAQRARNADIIRRLFKTQNIPVLKQRMLDRLPKLNNLFSDGIRIWPIPNEVIDRIATTA